MTRQDFEARLVKLNRTCSELTTIISEQAQKIEELEVQLMHERRAQAEMARRNADERRRVLVVSGCRGRS